jgi:hypothetical protein
MLTKLSPEAREITVPAMLTINDAACSWRVTRNNGLRGPRGVEAARDQVMIAPVYAASIAVQSQSFPVALAPRSSRMAIARTRGPKRTITAISTTSADGLLETTRLTRGSMPAAEGSRPVAEGFLLSASNGPRRRMWPLARCVVQGVSWREGRDPARVSARTWANTLGQATVVAV